VCGGLGAVVASALDVAGVERLVGSAVGDVLASETLAAVVA